MRPKRGNRKTVKSNRLEVSLSETCSFREFINYRKSINVTKDEIWDELLTNPLPMLADDTVLDFIDGPFAWEYAATLPPGPVLELALKRLRISGCQASDMKEVVKVAEPRTSLRILQTVADIINDSNEFESIVETVWGSINDTERGRLFDWSIVGKLPSTLWRDRALELLKGMGSGEDVRPVYEYLIRSSKSQADADQVFDHFKIKPESLKGEISSLLRTTISNRYFLEASHNFIANCYSITAAMFVLLLWEVKSERKRLLGALGRWNSDEPAIHCLSAAASHMAIRSDLVLSVAKAGLDGVARALISSRLDSEIVMTITSAVANESTWAMRVLFSLPNQILLRHVNIVKVIFDYLDRLSIDQILEYYLLLLRLAKYSVSQHGDASLMGDLLIIFRKQITSNNSTVRIFGACAMLGLLQSTTIPYEKADVDENEATCSQVPRSRGHHHQDYSEIVSLFETFMNFSAQSLDPRPLSVFSHSFASLIHHLPPDLSKFLNRKVSKILEGNFIVELNKHHDRFHSLDGDEALIGIKLISPGVPFMFDVLQASEKVCNNGVLNNIDALLGCPIINLPRCHGTLLNWFKSLVNSFYDQDDKEVQRKCRQRLELLGDLERMESKSYRKLNNDKTGISSEDYAMGSVELHEFLTELGCEGKREQLPDSRKELSDTTVATVNLDPAVAIRYLTVESIQDYLVKSLDMISVTELKDETIIDLVEKVPKMATTIGLILSLCEELKKRNRAKYIESVFGTIRPMTDKLTGENLCKFLSLSSYLSLSSSSTRTTDDYDSLCQKAIDFALSTVCTPAESSKVLSMVLSLNKFSLNTIDDLANRLGSIDRVRKRNAYAEILIGLSKTPLDSLPLLEKSCGVLEKLTSISRTGDDMRLIEIILRHSRTFIDRINREGITIMEQSFQSSCQNILEILKTLQQATRSLQILCNHVKADQHCRSQNLLPQTRKSLEMLLFGVKRMLQTNGCISAFWIGNLKHRAIDGTEVGSQILLDDISSPSFGSPDNTGTKDEPSVLSKDIISDSSEPEDPDKE